jgi:hypothetical protein
MSYSSKLALCFYENHQSRVYKPDPGLLVLALEERELPQHWCILREVKHTWIDAHNICIHFGYSDTMYFLVLRRHLNPSLSEHETVHWNMPETPKTIVHSQKSSCLEYVLDPEVTD